jgi:hypothetical protein
MSRHSILGHSDYRCIHGIWGRFSTEKESFPSHNRDVLPLHTKNIFIPSIVCKNIFNRFQLIKTFVKDLTFKRENHVGRKKIPFQTFSSFVSCGEEWQFLKFDIFSDFDKTKILSRVLVGQER